jgi:phage-related tail fiber protein
VPDLRGEFIRGWDDSRGVDSGSAFGSAQADDFKSHTHTWQGDELRGEVGGLSDPDFGQWV